MSELTMRGMLCMLALAAGGGAARVSPGDWAGGLAEYSYPPDSTPPQGDSYTTANLNLSYVDESGVMRFNFTEEEGKYGEGRVEDARGLVVHVQSWGEEDDHSGCRRPLRGTRPIPQDVPWIALIKRGSCNFETKVQYAYEAKASGVLIYNNKEWPTLDKMKLSEKKRNISAVFTFKHKGDELARLVDAGKDVMLHIQVATHCTRPPNNMNRTSVLFVSISFILLMVMSLAWLVFYYIQRFRYIHAKDRLSKRLCSAAKKALSKIPVKNLKSEDKEMQGDGECCAVCIEPYKISDLLRVLPCRHDFHKSCIDPWLLEHRTCPMCKMDILKYYGFVFTGSQESILQLDAEEGDRRGTGGVSPLPRQASRTSSYSAGHSERSSRASSPDELSPTLPSSPPAEGVSFPKRVLSSTETPLFSKKPTALPIPGCSCQPMETAVAFDAVCEKLKENLARDAV